MVDILPLERPQRAALKQFIKFCIIGASSTVVDVGISKALMHFVHMRWGVAQTISFPVAVTNGFIWNSLWTFRGMGSGKRHEQYLKFVAINLVGYALTIGIMNTVLALLFAATRELDADGNPPHLHWNIAKALSIVLVSLWNFFANRRWTFGGEPA